MKKSNFLFTLDVEPDLHKMTYKGITDGLRKAEKIFDKQNIKPILFATCDCIERFPKLFRKLMKKGWEISLHGYRHVRYDELSEDKKEEEIKKALTCFKKYLKIKPRGFRAPQHSIDNKTLDLLEKYGFEYDSSIASLNFLQLLFFPKRFSLWLKHFLSRRNPYKIRKNLVEIPPSSLFLPFVALPLRISFLFSYLFLNVLKLTHRDIVFYCHSWDFIKLPESRLDRLFSHKRFIENLDRLLKKN